MNPKPKAVKSTKDLKRELWRIRRDEGAESIETFVMPLINSFEAGLREQFARAKERVEVPLPPSQEKRKGYREGWVDVLRRVLGEEED